MLVDLVPVVFRIQTALKWPGREEDGSIPAVYALSVNLTTPLGVCMNLPQSFEAPRSAFFVLQQTHDVKPYVKEVVTGQCTVLNLPKPYKTSRGFDRL